MSAQIDLLHPDARRVLRYCAVLGRSFRVEVLRRTLATDGLVADASTLSSLGAFLQPDGPDRWRFRNSLVRDAAYEGLAYKIRSRLHRAAGETLEAMSTDLDADSPTLALHFWRAGDAERTWKYAQEAGELARHAYSNVDAAELYERALDVSRRVPGVTDADRAILWAILGDLRELAGVLDGSVEAYRRAAELTSDPVTKAEIMAKRVRVHRRAGQSSTALRLTTQARKHLRDSAGPQSDRVNASLDNLIAQVRLGQEKPREAHIWSQRAAEQSRRTGDLENLGSALMSMGHAEWQLGVVGDGEHFRQALEIFESKKDLPSEAVARANLAVLRFGAGHWTEAISLFESSRAAALRAGWDVYAAETDMNIADILIKQGHLSDGEEVVRSAVRVLRASGVGFMAVYGDQLLAAIELARGNALDAEQQSARVVEAFLGLASPLSALEASLLRAQAAVDLGRPEDALAIVDEAERAAGTEAMALHSQTQLVRGKALTALDRLDEADEAIEAGLQAATDQGLPYEKARLLQLRSRRRAQGGADREAESDIAKALQILAAIGAPQ